MNEVQESMRAGLLPEEVPYRTTLVWMPIETHDRLKDLTEWGGLPWKYCSEDGVVVTALDDEEAQKVYFWAKLTSDDQGRVRRY